MQHSPITHSHPRWLAALLLSLLSVGTQADEITLDALLALDAPPPGVVFEIVSREPDALATALPRVRGAIQQLQRRFPGVPVAVVSHGREMFALLASDAKAQEEIHALARELDAAGTAVEVCGTYAERKGHAIEDFPDYVRVTAEGPASINDYRALDYLHVRIRD